MEEIPSTSGHDTGPTRYHTGLQKFGMLSRFMLPLVLTNMVPDVAEQAINRGITSIASDEMTTLLASYGLAYYITKIFINMAIELRHIGIVLVRTKEDNVRMTAFSLVNGLLLSAMLLVIGLSPLGTLIIKDLHGQSEEVAGITCSIITYLSPTPVLEAIGYYYEGGLVGYKYTGYAGIAKMTDFAMQVTFTVSLLFTSTRTEPVLVPVFSLYAGIIGRLVLALGFWYILVRRKLPHRLPTEKPLTIAKSVWFLLPLVMVRLVQVCSRPMINLVVSRSLSKSAGEEEAAKAVAVLTAVYPAGRMVFSWLNDLRAIPPTFHKTTDQHEKFKMKTLIMYSVFCMAASFTANLILYVIPGVGFQIMHTIIGLNEELARLSVTPLRICTVLPLCVGPRAIQTGILLLKKKTMYLTPSAIFRFLGLILFLSTLSHTRLSGANLGITSLVLSFAVETVFVTAALTFLKYRENIKIACCRTRNHSERDNSKIAEELPLNDKLT